MMQLAPPARRLRLQACVRVSPDLLRPRTQSDEKGAGKASVCPPVSSVFNMCQHERRRTASTPPPHLAPRVAQCTVLQLLRPRNFLARPQV
eukprot:scaffold38071_cov107-Isochrysis_galbana.AAC.8